MASTTRPDTPPAPDGAPPQATHHDLPAHEVVLLLETDAARGLDEQTATDRFEQFGPNELPPAGGRGALRRFLDQFHNPLIYVLLAAGAITFLLDERIDSAVIFAVVALNAVIGYVQESRAQAALDALRSLVRTEARVLRDGRQRTVPSEQLVPGDLVVLEAGDKVPADLRLVRGAELDVDESALTGESQPVSKDEVVLPPDTPVADRHNMVYSGTLVTRGSGAGIAVATGAETELGEIHRLVGAAEVLATPLTRKLAGFSRLLTYVILGLAALTFAVGLARGEDATYMFTAAVALAVGAIPEGLPAAVTIALAIGVSRMARRRAVVRRLPAVETLGSTTVICSDKTGTLTENQMTVRAIWTPDGSYHVTGSGYAPEGGVHTADGEPTEADHSAALRWSLIAGVACSDARLTQHGDQWTVIGDPTEGALRISAHKAGLDLDALESTHARLDTIPFSSERQFMATLHTADEPVAHATDEADHVVGGEAGGERRVVLAKGAVERILSLCRDELAADGSTRPLDAGAALAAADRLAEEGLRVIATARGDRRAVEPLDEDAVTGTMTFTGLQAMLDPSRPDVADAIASCRTAGVAVKMITGDHASTATAIARDIGLLPADAPPTEGDGDASTAGTDAGDRAAPPVGIDGHVLRGQDLDRLEGDDYDDAVERTTVFARVSPAQKLRLVESLQHRGHVVAMTGDGVNDAPALRQADIGVAMGRSGTEVAKDAADIVLIEDDFTTIEAAVEEGRGAFDNLTKFIVWTLPTSMGEGFIILLAILLGTALPILPVQALWINMTTAVALGLMLAFEPKEPGIMQRPPRAPSRPLLTRTLLVRIALVSALLVAGTWWIFTWLRGEGHSLPQARTASVNLIVMVELFYLFSCRSLTRSVWRIGPFSNPWILVGVSVQLLAQLTVTYVPVMQDVFDTASIDVATWLQIILISLLAVTVVGVDKRLRRTAF